MDTTPETALRNDRRKGGAVPALLLCALFLALVWPVIFLGSSGTSEAYDQRESHLPVIRMMADQWPDVDLVNYRSTTAPGYHLALASIARFVTDSVLVLQLLSSLAGLVLVLAAWRYAARAAGARAALTLTLPLLTSSYVIGGSIWLTTDNAALAFVTLALGGAVLGGAALGSSGAPATVRQALFATLAVFIRQIHVWVTAPIAVAALLASPFGARLPESIRGERSTGWGGLAIGAAALLVPFVLLGWLVSMWGGLTPPFFADQHDSGANPANLAVILALFGVFGLFFMPVLASDVRRWLPLDRFGAIAFAVGLGVSLAFATSFDLDAGRWGGAIWALVQSTPTIGDRSIVLPLLAGYGALVLLRAAGVCLAAGRGRDVTVLLVGLAGWTAAQMVNAQAWQRYCEPMVLIALAWMTALVLSGVQRRPSRWWVGPAALAVAQVGLLVKLLYLQLEA